MKTDYKNISDEEYIATAARILAGWANRTIDPEILGDGCLSTKAMRAKVVDFVKGTKDFFSRENLNRKRALAIGFKPWSEDMPKLLLMPLWYCVMLEEGQEVVCISGDVEKYSRKTTDHDMRFGVIAYGFEFEESEVKK